MFQFCPGDPKSWANHPVSVAGALGLTMLMGFVIMLFL
jgi:hypothetical protein